MIKHPFQMNKWLKFNTDSRIFTQMQNAPYPHPDRDEGFTGNNRKFYPRDPHYCDSTVCVTIPNNFKDGESTDVMVYMHGLNTALNLDAFGVPKAIAASGKNMIAIIPQGPYKAPVDIFGGKLEDNGGLKRLLSETMSFLVNGKILNTKNIGRLIMACHSGGFHAMKACLDQGGVNSLITDVYMFDSIFMHEDFFASWAMRRLDVRFITVCSKSTIKQHGIFRGLVSLSDGFREVSDTDSNMVLDHGPGITIFNSTKLGHNACTKYLPEILRTSTIANR
jgi:hypothetical protein